MCAAMSSPCFSGVIVPSGGNMSDIFCTDLFASCLYGARGGSGEKIYIV